MNAIKVFMVLVVLTGLIMIATSSGDIKVLLGIPTLLTIVYMLAKTPTKVEDEIITEIYRQRNM